MILSENGFPLIATNFIGQKAAVFFKGNKNADGTDVVELAKFGSWQPCCSAGRKTLFVQEKAPAFN